MAPVKGTSGNDFVSGCAQKDLLPGLAGDDLVVGVAGDDSASGNQGSGTVWGGSGNDFLYGGGDGERVFADRGNDTVCGDTGNDTLTGGTGSDFPVGGEEDADLVFGNTGDDCLSGNQGKDTLHGGKGKDLIAGGKDDDWGFGDLGDDTVAGDSGNDTIVGGQQETKGGETDGSDLLSGDRGEDLLYGNKGEDTLSGGEGNDSLCGGFDSDQLSGEEGNDRLAGDLGADSLTGGSGSDIFEIGRRNDVPGFLSTGGSNIEDADYITDFTHGQDLIELIGGVTFDDLDIVSDAGNTIVQDKVTGQYLAIVKGALSLARQDFTPFAPPLPTIETPATTSVAPETPAPTATPKPAPTATPTPATTSVAPETPAPTATPKPAPTATPTPATTSVAPETPATATPAPAPTPTPTPAPTPIPTETPAPTPIPTETPAPTPIPTETPAPTPIPTETPAPTPIPTETPAPTPIPTETPAPTPIPTETPAPTPIPTETPAPTPIPTETPAPTPIPTETPAPTPIPTETPAPTPIPTETPAPTPIPTETPAPTPIPTETPAPTPIPTETPAPTPIPTETPAPTPIPTETPAPTPIPTETPAPTPIPTETPAPTPIPTETPAPTPIPTETPAPTPIPTETPAPTPIPTETLAPTPIPTETLAPTPIPTETLATPTPVPAPTPIPTETPAPTPIPTETLATPTPVPAPTPIPTETPAPTPIPTETLATPTPVPAPTPIPAETPAPTPIPAETPAPTPIPTPVPAPTPIPAETPAPTPIPTETPAPTPIPTETPAPTPIPTETPAPTPIPTETPAPTPIPTETPATTPAETPTPTPAPTPAPTPNSSAPADIFLTGGAAVDENSAPGTVIGTFSTLDSDEGDTHTYSLVDDAGGRFAIVGTQLTVAAGTLLDFETNPSYNIGVRVTDAAGNTFEKVLPIAINNINDAPTVGLPIPNQPAAEDTPFSFIIDANTFNDADGDTLTYTASLAGGAPLPNWLTFNPSTGEFTGTPSNSDVGAISVGVIANDGNGGAVADSFEIAVANTNDAPTLTGTSVSLTDIDEDAATNSGDAVSAFSSMISDADPGAVQGIAVTAADNTNGKWQYYTTDGTGWQDFSATAGALADISTSARLLSAGAGNQIRFLPNPNYNGSAGTLTFRAWDGTAGADGGTADTTTNGGATAFSSDTAAATLKVNPVADAPVANPDTLPDGTVLLRSWLDIPVASLLANDTDADGDSLTLTAVSNPSNGEVSLDSATGTITFRANTVGAASFDYTISDGTGNTSTATVSLSVTNQINLSDIVSGTGLPAGAAGFVINGEAAYSESGRSVSGAGDVNADGLADVIVGAPLASFNGNLFGKSYVIFGKLDSTPVNLNALGAGGFAMNDEADLSGFGLSVSGAGDVNADGLADVIVGAPSAAFSGKSYVVFGKKDSTAVNFYPPGAAGFAINGQTTDYEFGNSVSGAGDVNGDGLADVIVNAPIASSSSKSYVVFGKTDSKDINLSELDKQGFAINGEPQSLWSVNSVSGAGDVNGDGLADLIAGAFLATPNGPDSGKSYVIFGKKDSTDVNLGALNQGGFAINGSETNEESGASVSEAGDVNGDGLADLIVGAQGPGPNGDQSGKSYVIFGKTDSTDVNLKDLGDGGFAINGEEAVDASGHSVSAAGDVNGDGLADLIVGAPGNPNGSDSGKSYVVFGKKDSADVNLKDLGDAGFAITGEAIGDFCGFSVSAAGDVNGDGLADLIVGAPHLQPSQTDSGTGDGQADSMVGAPGDASGAGSGKSYVIFGGDFTGAVTQLGGAGADTLTGTASSQALVGGSADDTLSDGNFTDALLYGGAGNDRLEIGNAGFRRLDGGLGVDTLALSGAGMTLDLTGTADNTKIAGIERIDLTGTGDNTLTLSETALLNLLAETTPANGYSTLTVLGDAGDAVNAGLAGWGLSSSSAGGFTTYTKDRLQLVLDSDLILS